MHQPCTQSTLALALEGRKGKTDSAGGPSVPSPKVRTAKPQVFVLVPIQRTQPQKPDVALCFLYHVDRRAGRLYIDLYTPDIILLKEHLEAYFTFFQVPVSLVVAKNKTWPWIP